MEIVFLGTGGGRFTTITQKRRTAGIRILDQDLNLHLDPGPGALVHSIAEGFDPQRLNAIFVSHCHPDHYTDAEVLIEAMTRGMTRKHGTLATAKSVLGGSNTCEASISKYHQQMPKQIIEAMPGMNFQVGHVDVSVTKAEHADPDAVGFRFEVSGHGSFAYTSDTEYFEEISSYYSGVRLLILCVMRPSGKPWKGHMTSDDAVRILRETRPQQAILTHLGMQMLYKGPREQAKMIQEESGVPTMAGVDGMRVAFGKDIVIHTPVKESQRRLNQFVE